MADQVQIVTFNTPASPGTVDVTHVGITQTFSAAILIFSRSTSDGTDNPHGVMGIGFVAPDGGLAEECGIAVQLENGIATPDNNSDNDNGTVCILANDGTTAVSRTITAEYSASIAGGVRLNFITTTDTAKCTAILFAGLSRAATGNCTTTTAGVSEPVGDAGVGNFTPDVVLFLSSDGALNSAHVNGTVRLGFALNRLGVPMRSAYVNWDDGTNDADGIVSDTEAWSAFTGTDRSEIDGATVTAFTASGFDLDAADSSPQANYLALKFTDPALNLFIENFAVSGSTGVQSFACGFQPQIVFGMSTLIVGENTLTDGATARAAGYFCFNSTVERAYTVHHNDPGTTSAHTRQGNHAVLTYSDTGAVAQQATLSAFTGTGFDLNFTTATAGHLTVLAIGAGGQVLVQGETERISDGVAFNLIRRSVFDETVRITDGALLLLADGLSALGPEGWVFAQAPKVGRVFAQTAAEGLTMSQAGKLGGVFSEEPEEGSVE